MKVFISRELGHCNTWFDLIDIQASWRICVTMKNNCNGFEI